MEESGGILIQEIIVTRTVCICAPTDLPYMPMPVCPQIDWGNVTQSQPEPQVEPEPEPTESPIVQSSTSIKLKASLLFLAFSTLLF